MGFQSSGIDAFVTLSSSAGRKIDVWMQVALGIRALLRVTTRLRQLRNGRADLVGKNR